MVVSNAAGGASAGVDRAEEMGLGRVCIAFAQWLPMLSEMVSDELQIHSSDCHRLSAFSGRGRGFWLSPLTHPRCTFQNQALINRCVGLHFKGTAEGGNGFGVLSLGGIA